MTAHAKCALGSLRCHKQSGALLCEMELHVCSYRKEVPPLQLLLQTKKGPENSVFSAVGYLACRANSDLFFFLSLLSQRT